MNESAGELCGQGTDVSGRARAAQSPRAFLELQQSVMELKNYLGPAHQPELVAGCPLYRGWVVLDSGDFGPQLPDLLGQPGDFVVGTHLFLTQAL